MKKNLQKSAILFGTKSNAYLQINRPIFAYSWLFLAIFTYLRICSKSPRIYFAFRAEYSYLFLPIFRHLTCVRHSSRRKKCSCEVQPSSNDKKFICWGRRKKENWRPSLLPCRWKEKYLLGCSGSGTLSLAFIGVYFYC